MIGDIRTIIKGYAQGYFLMDNGNGKLDWYCSKKRALIPLDERFRYPKSLRRALNQERFAVAINKDFPAVCAGCAARPSTWISPELLAIYLALHEAGWAHSFETWQGNKLAGGILGIVLRGAFIGESMFYQVPEASKVVMIKLYDKIGRTFTPAQLPPLRCSNPKPPLGTFRRSQSFATTSFNSFLLFSLIITNPG